MIDELSERERFIYHVGMNVILKASTGEDVHKLIYHIRKHRCRHITDEDVKKLIVLMRDEIQISKIMWEEP